MRLISLMFLLLPAQGGELELARYQAGRLFTDGKLEEAEQVLRKAVDVERRAGGADRLFPLALNELGTLNQDLGRYREAERFYRESLARADPPQAGWSAGFPLTNLASLMMSCGRPKDSLEFAIKGVQSYVQTHGAGSVHAGRAQNSVAVALVQLGRLEEAEAAARAAATILKGHANGENLGVSYYVLAEVAWIRADTVRAEELLRTANAIWAESLPADHPTAITGVASLGAMKARSDSRESDRLFQRALELAEAKLGKQHYFSGTILMLHADKLQAEGRKREAKELKRRGKAILSAHSRANLMHHSIDMSAFGVKALK